MAKSMNPTTTLDLNDALARFSGRRESLQRTAKAFVQTYADIPAQLKTHTSAGAIHTLSDLAHRIKGSAGVLGAKELARLSGALEDAVRDGDQEYALELAPDMTAALEAALSQLSELELPEPSGVPPGEAAILAAQLTPLLRSGDFSAGDLLDQLARQLSGSEFAVRVDVIRRHFDALDTDDAAILSVSLQEALEAKQ
jgi:HPt (histidine-containing phosphotransfer) domain-containing protein